MALRFFIILLTFVYVVSGNAQDRAGLRISPDNSGKEGGHSGCDLFTANFDSIEEFTSFFQKLKKASKAPQADRLASLMNFPVQVSLKKKTFVLENKNDVQKNLKTIFNSKLNKVIQNQKLNRIFCNTKGVMIGDGEVWITKSNGKIGINGINIF